MNNFTVRTLTGMVYVTVTIACLLGNFWSALCFGSLIVFFSTREFIHLTSGQSGPWLIADSLFVVCTFLLLFFNQGELVNPGYFNAIFTLLCLAYAFLFLYRPRLQIIAIFTGLATAVVYIALPMSMLFKTGSLELQTNSELIPFNGAYILAVFILIWISDTFAYLSGRSFGKTPLFKSISPGKTLEGFLGGAVATMLCSYFFMIFLMPLSTWQSVTVGLLVAAAGATGDLFESLIKRTLGVKDSGTALPGHGGFLDRFDSVFFAGPAVYAYLRWYAI